MPNLKPFLPWLTRALAIVGIVAIVAVIALSLGRDIIPSFESYDEMATVRSVGYDTSIAPSSPELLKDASITVEQKIIKTGGLSLTVNDAVETASLIRAFTMKKGGNVQISSVVEQEDGTHSGYVTVRVPSIAFEESMTAIKALAFVVESETVSSQDVTEQYIDLAARLNNAKAQEARYVEILRSANTVEEMLQIEQALANVRATIESYTGQMQYLEGQTEMSTISISLFEEPAVVVGGKVFRPWTTVKQAAQAVIVIAQKLVEAIIWIVIVGLGVGLPLMLIGWLGWKGFSRYRQR